MNLFQYSHMIVFDQILDLIMNLFSFILELFSYFLRLIIKILGYSLHQILELFGYQLELSSLKFDYLFYSLFYLILDLFNYHYLTHLLNYSNNDKDLFNSSIHLHYLIIYIDPYQRNSLLNKRIALIINHQLSYFIYFMIDLHPYYCCLSIDLFLVLVLTIFYYSQFLFLNRLLHYFHCLSINLIQRLRFHCLKLSSYSLSISIIIVIYIRQLLFINN